MATEIETRVHSALFSRRIPFNMYAFSNNSFAVISTVRGRKLSINLAHQIIVNDDKSFDVSDFTATTNCRTASQAAALVVKLIRQAEMTFMKHTKRQ